MTRYCVDGHEFDPAVYPDCDMLGDGEFAPFRIFDIEAQAYLDGDYGTREEAERQITERLTNV